MIQIRPVSDLRNKFTDIEEVVKTGQPVYLTKNGYGSMVVLSLDAYSKLTEDVEYVKRWVMYLKKIILFLPDL